MLARAFILLAAAGLAVAQIPGISANCSAALLVVTNDSGASACLSPTSLAGLITGGSGSEVNVIDQWLDKVCPAAPCSNATLATVVNTIVGGCSNELSTLGITTSASELVPIVQQFYPTVRQVACLKDGSTNCITEALDNIQTATGQNITLSNFLSVLDLSGNLPSNVTCTACEQASYNIIAQQQPSVASGIQSALQSKCGSSFTDGTQPSGIVEAASTASAGTSSNSAAHMDLSSSIPVFVSLGLSSLVAFGSAILFV
ncbi:hypothetical protein AX14_010243 [Amanita brunnescens Koide BX004]|nr:hypothetical protein AX14_010243 [Amanita brunnescens Koide BX004]